MALHGNDWITSWFNASHPHRISLTTIFDIVSVGRSHHVCLSGLNILSLLLADGIMGLSKIYYS